MSSKAARAVLGVVLTATLALVACTDRSITAPDAAVQRSGDQSHIFGLGGLLGGVQSLLVSPLQRTTPLASNVTWSFTVGSSGGASANAATGLVIVVPPGALSSTKTITVTAYAGSAVAYGFSPHIEFNKNIYLTQSLNGTNAGILSSLLLKGAHFAGSTPTYSGPLAIVDEIVGSLVIPWMNTVTIGVDHFSGWIFTSGYSSESASSSTGEAQ